MAKKRKEKKKRVFDEEQDYLEDIDQPSRIIIWLTYPFDPVCYYLSNMFIVLELFTLAIQFIRNNQTNTRFMLNAMVWAFNFNLIYALECICTLVVQIRKVDSVSTSIVQRSNLLVLVELASCFPWQTVFRKSDPHTKSLLSLVRTVKMVRVFHFYYNLRRTWCNRAWRRLMELIALLVITLSYIVIVYKIIFCICNECVHNMEFSNGIYEIVARRTISRWEMHQHTFESLSIPYFTFELFALLALLYLTFVIMKLIASYMILSAICEYHHKFEYVEKVNFFKCYFIKHLALCEKTADAVMNYYKSLWIHKSGYNTHFVRHVRDFFPPNFNNEISIDYSWFAFEHSLLFRDTELYVLRLLASYMDKTIHVDGEHVFKKDELKDKMVYINKGVIEVLSNENGESGVLCLTTGTCIGEASLLIPYNSGVHFRCKTTSDIYILRRNDFMQICRHYPAMYKVFLKRILRRFADAEKLMEIKLAHPKGNRNLLQLKNTLHRLFSKNKELYGKHAPLNIYLSSELKFDQQYYEFNTKRYLQLLAIKERKQFDTDKVFIKSTGLWILRPGSPVLRAWEYFILLLCLTVALWIPYVCSTKDQAVSSEFLVLFTVFWILDFLLLIVTPVSKESKATTIPAILSERLKDITFALDFLAILPNFVLSSLIPHHLLEYNMAWMYMNKVFKSYRLMKFFKDWESNFNVNFLLHTVVKYLFLYFLLIYYTSCILVAMGVSDSLFAPIAVQMSSGVGYVFSTDELTYIPYIIFVDYIAYYLEFSATITVIAAFYLQFNKRKKIQAFFSRVYNCTHKRTDKINLLNRLNYCLQTHLNDNGGLLMMISVPKFLVLTPFFNNMVQEEAFTEILAEVEILDLFPPEFILKLATICTKTVHHHQCILISRGVIYDSVFILHQGVAHSVVGRDFYDTKRGTLLNILEIGFGLPSAMTVICLTEVISISFKYSEFERLMAEFPQSFDVFHKVISDNREIGMQLMRMGRTKHQPKIRVKNYGDFQLWHFKTDAKTFEGHDYFQPFHRISPFTFLCYVLMRRTIHPESKFLLIWERIRLVCAILTSILFVIPIFNSVRLKPKMIIFVVLDLAALADIYVRMHVCFYNKSGILVRHPLKTAGHYLTHGFIVDLIGILPFNYVIPDDDMKFFFIWNSFRLMQMHRFYSYKASFMWPSVSLQMAVNFVSMVVIINYCSCVIVVNDCDSSYKNGTEWVLLCKTLNFEYVECFAYFFYVTSSTVTTIAMNTYISFEYSSFLINFVCNLSALAIIGKIFIISSIFSSYCSNEVRLPFFRHSTASLLRAMRKAKVSFYLRHETKKYFDTMWMVIGDGNPYELYKNLNLSLKRDLLFEFYGKNLTLNSLLSEDKTLLHDFYKNCLIEMDMMSFAKDGYILTINDIQGKIFFLHTGYVDVVAADGTVLCRLGESSIFGNLENVTLHRERVSVVTDTTVLVFFMRTRTFYKLINYFPKLKNTFLELKRRTQYYIESSAPKMVKPQVNIRAYNKAMVRYRLFRKFALFHALVPCYIGIIIELYQISVCHVDVPFLVVQYLMDWLHLCYSLWKFYVGYLDANGELVIDPVEQRKPHMRRSHLLMTVVTCLPLDFPLLLAFSLEKIKTDSVYFSLLRGNRLLRVYYLVRYFHVHMYKYSLTNGGTVFKRAIIFVMQLVMYVVVGAALILVMERAYFFITRKKSFSVHYFKVRRWLWRLHKAPPADKFSIFFKYCYFIGMLLTFKSDKNYYVSSTELMFFYMFIILASYIFSILLFAQIFEVMVENLSSHIHYGYLINFIKAFLRTSASPIIKQRLEQHMHYKWLHNLNYSKRILELTPPYLHQAIAYSLYGHLFRNHVVFGKTHADFVRQLIVRAKPVLYLYNDFITYKNIDRECMYFVISGHVAELCDETDHLEMAHRILGPGDSFGITEGLLPKNPFKFNYKTIECSEILELMLNDWKYLLDHFPATKEHIYNVAAQLDTS